MPLQAALFDTAPHTTRAITKAERFEAACRMLAPLIAAGLTNQEISERETWNPFDVADIRAHLETIERSQERMF